MNFEAVLHYKHQNQGRDEKKKRRHASGASATSEASNSDSEVDSTDHSPSPGQKKVNEVRVEDDPRKPSVVFCCKRFQFSQRIDPCPPCMAWCCFLSFYRTSQRLCSSTQYRLFKDSSAPFPSPGEITCRTRLGERNNYKASDACCHTFPINIKPL